MNRMILCPGCQRRVMVATGMEGDKLHCPICGGLFVVCRRSDEENGGHRELVAILLLEGRKFDGNRGANANTPDANIEVVAAVNPIVVPPKCGGESAAAAETPTARPSVIEFRCGYCHTRYDADEGDVGQTFPCEVCKHPMRVPPMCGGQNNDKPPVVTYSPSVAHSVTGEKAGPSRSLLSAILTLGFTLLLWPLLSISNPNWQPWPRKKWLTWLLSITSWAMIWVALAYLDVVPSPWSRYLWLNEIRDDEDFFFSMAFSGDGQTLATGDFHHRVKIWNMKSGRQTAVLDNSPRICSAFSPDGRILATASEDDDSIELHSPDVSSFYAHQGGVKLVAFAFTKEGKYLVSWGGDGTIRTRDLSRPERSIQPFQVPSADLVAFQASGKMAAWRSRHSEKVTLLDMTNGQTTTLSSGTGFGALAFSPDQKSLAAVVGTSGTEFRVWDLKTLNVVSQSKRDDSPITALAFGSDSRFLAVAKSDGSVKVWDIVGNSIKSELKSSCTIHELAFDPTGEKLACAGDDNSATLWELGSGQRIANLEGHEGPVTSLAFRPNASVLATSSRDRTVKLWNSNHGRKMDGGFVVGSAVECLALDSGGKILAAAYNRQIELWDVGDSRQIGTLQGHPFVTMLAFSPDGKMLSSLSQDQLSFWDVASHRMITDTHPEKEDGFHTRFTAMALSPDGKLLAVAKARRNTGARLPTTSDEEDCSVDFWTFADFQHSGRTFIAHYASINCLAFSPDGNLLASASNDKTINLYNLERLNRRSNSPEVEQIETFAALTGHLGRVNSVAFRRDGKILASSGDDKTVRIWDSKNGLEKEVLPFDNQNVEAVIFRPRTNILAIRASGRMRFLDTSTNHH